MKRFTLNAIRSLIFILGSTALTVGCSPAQKKDLDAYYESRPLMGTFFQITVCYADDQANRLPAAVQKAWARLDEIAWRMNVYDEKSDVAKVNRAFQAPVTIQEDTYGLIRRSIEFSSLTDNAFDITVWPLIKMWKDAEKKRTKPDPSQIREMLEAVGPENIELLDDRRVRTRHQHTAIDLGGIAKGYSLDEAATILREEGFSNFQVDGGGDVYVGGTNCQGGVWRIGIRAPQAERKVAQVVAVQDAAVTTSGNYEQYYNIENQRWSHIMDTLSGFPQAGVISASVIAPSGEEADALSTAFCVLNPERSLQIIERFGPRYACLIYYEDEKKRIQKAQSAHWKNFHLQ